jgi:transglutaminase-like putative cysteine protease
MIMRLKISHRAEYQSDPATPYALQRLRLFPAPGPAQTVRSWTLAMEGAREEVRFSDHFGNDTRLISIEGVEHPVIIEVGGEVETVNKAGVTGQHRGFAPLWLFERGTPLTAAGTEIEGLAAGIADGADIGRLHELMAAVNQRMSGIAAGDAAEASAEEALAKGAGDSIDQAHVFIAAARLLGFPARFVGGYKAMEEGVEQASPHAWAEVHVSALGWVGFDVASQISPDDTYVRVATGRDHRDAMAISGIAGAVGGARLAVRITLEQVSSSASQASQQRQG